MLCLTVLDRHNALTNTGVSLSIRGLYVPRSIAGDQDPGDILDRMLDHGSRYKNLATHFGRGVVMVLGTELPETK